MTFYESKPSVIEATQHTGDFTALREFAGNRVTIRPDDGTLMLLAGKDGAQEWVPVPLGHWLVHQPGDLSDIWPVDPSYFAAKYQEVHSVGGNWTPDHKCCPCVERLRAQNKASSDAWTKRTADLCSDLDGLRHLMHEGLAAHRKGHIGISTYGQAALAEALRIADEAEGKIEALEQQMLRERRARIAAESRLNGPLRPRPRPEPKGKHFEGVHSGRAQGGE